MLPPTVRPEGRRLSVVLTLAVNEPLQAVNSLLLRRNGFAICTLLRCIIGCWADAEARDFARRLPIIMPSGIRR
jgi:hypothetical protein